MKKYFSLAILIIVLTISNILNVAAIDVYRSPQRFDGYDYFRNWHPNYGYNIEDRGLFRQNIYTNEVEKLADNVIMYSFEEDCILYQDWHEEAPPDLYIIEKGNKNPKKVFTFDDIWLHEYDSQGAYYIENKAVYYIDFKNSNEKTVILTDDSLSKNDVSTIPRNGNYLLYEYLDEETDTMMRGLIDIQNRCISLTGDYRSDIFDIGSRYPDSNSEKIIYTKTENNKKYLIVANNQNIDDNIIIELPENIHYYAAQTFHEEENVILQARDLSSYEQKIFVVNLKNHEVKLLTDNNWRFNDYIYHDDKILLYDYFGDIRKINLDGTDDCEVWNKYSPWYYSFYGNKIIATPHNEDEPQFMPSVCEYFPITYSQDLKDKLIGVTALKLDSCDAIVNNELCAVDPDNLLVRPFITKENRTLVPIRFIAEKLGGEVIWNQDEQSVTVKFEEKTLVFKIGSDKTLVNDNEEVMDTTPILINGRTMLPLRFISEYGLDKQILWDNGLILISDNVLSLSNDEINIIKEQFFRFDEATDGSGL